MPQKRTYHYTDCFIQLRGIVRWYTCKTTTGRFLLVETNCSCKCVNYVFTSASLCPSAWLRNSFSAWIDNCCSAVTRKLYVYKQIKIYFSHDSSLLCFSQLLWRSRGTTRNVIAQNLLTSIANQKNKISCPPAHPMNSKSMHIFIMYKCDPSLIKFMYNITYQ